MGTSQDKDDVSVDVYQNLYSTYLGGNKLYVTNTGNETAFFYLYDVSGRVLQKQEVRTVSSMQTLPETRGVYIVHLQSGKDAYTERIVVR